MGVRMSKVVKAHVESLFKFNCSIIGVKRDKASPKHFFDVTLEIDGLSDHVTLNVEFRREGYGEAVLNYIEDDIESDKTGKLFCQWIDGLILHQLFMNDFQWKILNILKDDFH